MVKLGEIAKVTGQWEDQNFKYRRNDPRYGEKTRSITRFIDDNPGTTFAQLYNMGFNHSTLTTTLRRLVNNGTIKVSEQDFKKRYYPKSYRFSDEMKATEDSTKPETIKVTPPYDEIKRLAKDYYWESLGDPSLTRFIKWLEDHDPS